MSDYLHGSDILGATFTSTRTITPTTIAPKTLTTTSTLTAAQIEAQRVAEAQRIAAAKLEAQRLAATAAQIEAQRIAAAEAAKLEAQRLAATAAQIEAQRIAAAKEAAAKLEAQQLAAQAAKEIEAQAALRLQVQQRLETQRLAANAAQIEAQRQADAARLTTTASTVKPASVEPEKPGLLSSIVSLFKPEAAPMTTTATTIKPAAAPARTPAEEARAKSAKANANATAGRAIAAGNKLARKRPASGAALAAVGKRLAAKATQIKGIDIVEDILGELYGTRSSSRRRKPVSNYLHGSDILGAGTIPFGEPMMSATAVNTSVLQAGVDQLISETNGVDFLTRLGDVLDRIVAIGAQLPESQTALIDEADSILKEGDGLLLSVNEDAYITNPSQFGIAAQLAQPIIEKAFSWIGRANAALKVRPPVDVPVDVPTGPPVDPPVDPLDDPLKDDPPVTTDDPAAAFAQLQTAIESVLTVGAQLPAEQNALVTEANAILPRADALVNAGVVNATTAVQARAIAAELNAWVVRANAALGVSNAPFNPFGGASQTPPGGFGSTFSTSDGGFGGGGGGGGGFGDPGDPGDPGGIDWGDGQASEPGGAATEADLMDTLPGQEGAQDRQLQRFTTTPAKPKRSARMSSAMSSSTPLPVVPAKSWLTTTRWGLPTWGWGTIGITVLGGGGGYAWWRLKHKKH
ncbi:MAG: hypothetical protein Q7R30_23900 [Acidobacteriota bacterium]|nr:hypothetical protein [Acidobacteriota bacterium]